MYDNHESKTVKSSVYLSRVIKIWQWTKLNSMCTWPQWSDTAWTYWVFQFAEFCTVTLRQVWYVCTKASKGFCFAIFPYASWISYKAFKICGTAFSFQPSMACPWVSINWISRLQWAVSMHHTLRESVFSHHFKYKSNNGHVMCIWSALYTNPRSQWACKEWVEHFLFVYTIFYLKFVVLFR